MTNKRERPDYWRKWTSYLALPILLIVVVLLFPLFLLAGAYGGIRKGFRAWKDEWLDVWRFYRGR